eukprot:scaffold189_cov118-Isochrysis_galbana.AAC.18
MSPRIASSTRRNAVASAGTDDEALAQSCENVAPPLCRRASTDARSSSSSTHEGAAALGVSATAGVPSDAGESFASCAAAANAALSA